MAHAPAPPPAAPLKPTTASAPLTRERLISKLSGIWTRRFALVVAPAGYGKTTVIADFATSSGVPTAWCRLEALDSDESRLVAHISREAKRTFPQLPTGRASFAEFSEAVERAVDSPALIVIDDAHTVDNTPAERALERFIEAPPRGTAVIVAGRAVLGFNLSRLRVLDSLVEIYADDLRFRQWEVEELFQRCYRQRLHPDEVAELTRRTDGWAAGLQLFHLATRDGSPHERREVLRGLSSHSNLVREFLTRNVLDQLPAELREFLLQTSLLGRLSGELCDRFLGRERSSDVLLELQRRRLFVQRHDADITYRYHEVIRSHLEAMLADNVGEAGVRELSIRAGRLLEECGALTDALRAYGRAEDSETVQRLIVEHGSRLATEPGLWIERLPASLLENDPWLLLALARRQAAAGRPRHAVDTYRRAERAFKGSAKSEQCREERLTVQAWTDPRSVRPHGDQWWRLLRLLGCDAGLPSNAGTAVPARDLVEEALQALLTGDADTALRAAALADGTHDAPTGVHLVARIIRGIASLLMHDEDGLAMLRAAEDRADRAGAGWLARLARAACVLAANGDSPDSAALVRTICAHDEDRWGEAIASLFQGLGALERGAPQLEPLDAARQNFEQLGARMLDAWARALSAVAMARCGLPDARARAVLAESTARRHGVGAACGYAYRAMALVAPEQADEYRLLEIDALAGTALAIGLDEPVEAALIGIASRGVGAAPLLRFTVFGGLAIHVNGELQDVSALKPRSRSLLRLLAANAGRPVHREVMCDALWPDATMDTALRSLQVAVSSVRQVLEPAMSPTRPAVVVRDGASYRLATDEWCSYDLTDFHGALEEIRALAAENIATAGQAFVTAIDRFGAPLLPEEGPAEWASSLRDQCAASIVEAGEHVARAALAHDAFDVAATACRRALDIDRYRDELWRLLLMSLERGGDHAGAAREDKRYGVVLTELGVARDDR